MHKARLAGGILLLAILAGSVLLLWHSLPRLLVSNPPPRISNTATLLKQVQTLSQLVTVKYVVEKVIIVEDAKWYELQFGESRLLMVAHGVVKAGVDLSELRPGDLELSRNKIIFKMPQARITDHYLDDRLTQVIERKTGLLRSFDKDLEQNARAQAVEEIDRAARNNGILKDADERARAQLTNLFRQLGFEEVEFRPGQKGKD